MKIAYVGVTGVALAGLFYVFHRYQNNDMNKVQAIAETKRTGPDASPEQQVQREPAEQGSPTSPEGRMQEDDRAVFKDIDQLRANRTPEAVDSLLNYLDHSDNWVKAHALKALRDIGSPRALPRLVSLLKSKGHEFVIRGAYMAIGGIGPNLTSSNEKRMAIDGLKKSLDLYREGVDSESRGNLYVLIEAASKIPGPESGEFMLAELPKFHELPHVQYSIIKALGEIKYKPAEQPLTQYRTDLIKEGPEPWGDKERYSELLKVVDHSLSRITAGQAD